MMNVSPIGGAGMAPEAVRAAGAATPGLATGDSFEAMFAKIAGNVRDGLQAGEAAAIEGVNGDTSVQKVVEAMMSAEQQLRAAIAVRDRVVAAYQEIARMQI